MIYAALWRVKVIGGGILKPDSPYFQEVLNVPAADRKWLNLQITPDYPLAPFRGGTSNRIFPHDNYIGDRFAPKRKLHWGQRKLLLCEIDFLTRYCTTSKQDVIYAGAADGRHIALLAELFPNLQFHLYDPRAFYPGLNSIKQIHTHQEFFTDDIASKWADRDVLFICDIRTFGAEDQMHAAMENQASQKKWVQIMQPRASMLKFKLPYPQKGENDRYRYLDGDIYFQVWGPVSTAETRLVVTPPFREKEYDCIQYERQLSYYNNVMRLSHFDVGVKGVWNGADIYLEQEILARYVAKYGGVVNELRELIGQHLGAFNKHLDW